MRAVGRGDRRAGDRGAGVLGGLPRGRGKRRGALRCAIGQGKILELQQQMIKVGEVLEGTQCGLQVDSKFTIAAGDILEAIVLVEK